MTFCGRDYFRISCYTVCIFGAVFMVGYWFYKFGIEDRDIGVVDYISFDEDKDITVPNLAICFQNPFLKSLVDIDKNLTTWSYREYLRGEGNEKNFFKVNYSDVTLDLKDYFEHAAIRLLDRTEITLKHSDIRHENIFNGFYHIFMKCFTSTVKQGTIRNIKGLWLYYNKTKLDNHLNSGSIFLLSNFYYPNQFVLEINPMKRYKMNSTNNAVTINIESLEILKRRNSKNRRCLDDLKSFDDLATQRFIAKAGCKPPYLSTFKNVAFCTEIENIKKSKLDFFELEKQYHSKPCRRISKLLSTYIGGKIDQSWLRFGIEYPKELKVISQSKEVDGHALIGNIGGYIGLFLGRLKIVRSSKL